MTINFSKPETVITKAIEYNGTMLFSQIKYHSLYKNQLGNYGYWVNKVTKKLLQTCNEYELADFVIA